MKGLPVSDVMARFKLATKTSYDAPHTIKGLWRVGMPLHVVTQGRVTAVLHITIEQLASIGVGVLKNTPIDTVTMPPCHNVMYAACEASKTVCVDHDGVTIPWLAERYGSAWVAVSTTLVVGQHVNGDPIMATLLLIQSKDRDVEPKVYLIHTMWRTLYIQERSYATVVKRLDKLVAVMGEDFVRRSVILEDTDQDGHTIDTPLCVAPSTPVPTDNVWMYLKGEYQESCYTSAANTVVKAMTLDTFSKVEDTTAYQRLCDERAKRTKY
jgi:hypothetical protein